MQAQASMVSAVQNRGKLPAPMLRVILKECCTSKACPSEVYIQACKAGLVGAHCLPIPG